MGFFNNRKETKPVDEGMIMDLGEARNYHNERYQKIRNMNLERMEERRKRLEEAEARRREVFAKDVQEMLDQMDDRFGPHHGPEPHRLHHGPHGPHHGTHGPHHGPHGPHHDPHHGPHNGPHHDPHHGPHGPIPPHLRRSLIDFKIGMEEWEILLEVFGDEETASAAGVIICDAPDEVKVLAHQLMKLIREVM